MAEGITGWRLHVGVIFPTPVPPRAVLEFYDAVPDGVDMTTVSLTIQQLSDDDMDEAIKGMERAAKQLANFDVDVIYQSGVPPVVRRGLGFGDELADRLSQASGLPAITDMSSVIDAMRTCEARDARHGDAVRAVHQRPAGRLSRRREDRDHQQHGARNQAERRDPPAADPGRIHGGAQDLPRIREEARRHLHSLRRLGQHPQHRSARKGPRYDRRHLDERHDLELDAARQGDRPDSADSGSCWRRSDPRPGASISKREVTRI